MNNSEHDPANPHSDNEESGSGSHDPGRDAHPGNDGSDAGTAASSTSMPSDEDVWRDLVARLESTESMPDDLEDTQPSARTDEVARPDDPPAPEQRTAADRFRQDHLGGPRDYAPPEESDGYVPEEPPSLAGAEPLVVLAWIGAIGAPLALLLSAFIFRSIPMLAVVSIVVVFIASVVFLLMRLPSERGDDHDDGAIV